MQAYKTIVVNESNVRQGWEQLDHKAHDLVMEGYSPLGPPAMTTDSESSDWVYITQTFWINPRTNPEGLL